MNMNRVWIVVAIAIITMPASSQTSTSDRPMSVRLGESVSITNDLSLKVTKSDPRLFSKIKVKGEPTVVVLELDSGKKGATFFYKAANDAKSSDVYVTVGASKLAPLAVVEDFPSWGADNDKEVEILEAGQGSGGDSVTFEGKGSISLLFDVPREQAKTPKKLAVTIQTTKPSERKVSIVASL